jgi:hypothetical protein
MNINKTGGDNTTSCVTLLGTSTAEGAYGRDSPMEDGDVRLERRATGSVINQAVTDYVIEFHTHSASPRNVGWSKTMDIEQQSRRAASRQAKNACVVRGAGLDAGQLGDVNLQKPPDFAIAISRNEHWCATNPGGEDSTVRLREP